MKTLLYYLLSILLPNLSELQRGMRWVSDDAAAPLALEVRWRDGHKVLCRLELMDDVQIQLVLDIAQRIAWPLFGTDKGAFLLAGDIEQDFDVARELILSSHLVADLARAHEAHLQLFLQSGRSRTSLKKAACETGSGR